MFMFGAQQPHRQAGVVDKYSQHFSAYPAVFFEQSHRLDNGGRVLLPPSCLAEMAVLNLTYPLQFEIRPHNGLSVYAGVLEFEAPGGNVVLPRWMFEALKLSPGDPVRLQTVSLPQGGLVKLRPHQRAFVEAIADPKKVLEDHLANHPVLTRGATIQINYADREFLLDVEDTLDVAGKRVKGISTVFHDARATELKVEFSRPRDMPDSPVAPAAPQFPRGSTSPPPQGTNVIGSQEGVTFTPLQFKPPSLLQDAQKKEPKKEIEVPAQPQFTPFVGAGRTLSGRPPPPNPAAAAAPAAGAPPARDPAAPQTFTPFNGPGKSLR